MKLVLAAVLATASAPALADTELSAQLAAGAATDTSAPTGEATASGVLSAGLVGRPAQLARHCLVIPGDDGSMLGLWSSDDPNDRDALRADVSALRIQTAATDSLVLTAGASARGCGWELGVHVSDQPVGSLRDTYWRSGRGIVATDVHFEMPAELFVGSVHSRFSMGSVGFDYTSRSHLGVDVGDDVDGWVRFLRWATEHAIVDVFDIRFTEFDGPEHELAGDPWSFTQLQAIDVAADIVAVDWRDASGYQLTLRGGIENLSPTAVYTQEGGAAVPPAQPNPSVIAPRYWAELAQHRGERTLAFGAGSWARLDPTGGAADVGELAIARADWKHGRYELHADLQGGRLRRALVSSLAQPGLAPAGTAMVMGRGTVEADVRLPHGLVVAGSSWLERSDRDDPRWIVPADGELATHAGADLDMRWKLH
jgi:hypothetical protein|nr:hypothetical protein [Kofleriaceae bacterium]